MRKMHMIVLGSLLSVLAMASVTFGWAANKELVSGIKKGGLLPAFHPTHVSGADKDTDTCPVCNYPFNPAVQVWVNTDTMQNVAAIAETLERAVKANTGQKMKAFIIFMNAKGESTQALADRLRKLAADRKIEQVALTYLPNSRHEAVAEYQINTDPRIKNTVFVYKARKVEAKFINLMADKRGLAALNNSLHTALNLNIPDAQTADSPSSVTGHGPIAWNDSLDSARKIAARDGKVLLVDFYADWCGPCQEMIKTTYQDKRVVQHSARFVPVLINIDKQPEVARKYNIEAIPTVLFLNASGKVLLQNIGYADGDQFLQLMEQASKKSRS
ncbi:MAG TPA: thioredoxin family protein [Chthonomonadaceae bacterium]|nr:thioredoxin family protein [Chthonomonadaceae bacterium]